MTVREKHFWHQMCAGNFEDEGKKTLPALRASSSVCPSALRRAPRIACRVIDLIWGDRKRFCGANFFDQFIDICHFKYESGHRLTLPLQWTTSDTLLPAEALPHP